ncbi:hypothetical protein AB0G15_42960 [Streptosporangium sp. NPDC023825]|uniref:hypothetical protein n=1 Tax=Streptosporangium sp. NPDC023825 TaxID=3154909 RepID=UPI0034186048
MNGSDPDGTTGFDSPSREAHSPSKRGSSAWIGLLLLLGILGVGFLYLNWDTKPRTVAWEWIPKPYDPPVQYAFTPENNECHQWPSRSEDESARPPLVACTEWRLRVNYVRDEGRQDIGIPYGGGCGGHRLGVSVSDDTCVSDIELYDAASQVEIDSKHRRDVPLQISRDGHRLAYFSKKHSQFLGWDLPTAQMKAISPRLDARMLNDIRSLEISPDGKFFAITFGGSRPRLLLTEFATGHTRTLPGVCTVLGIGKNPLRIAVQKDCPSIEDEGTTTRKMTILDRDGATVSEWTEGEFAGELSPDGRLFLAIHTDENDVDYLVTRDAMTGKLIKKLKLRLLSESSDAMGHAWLNANEYIIEAEPPEPGGSFGYYKVNVQSGRSDRIRDLNLDLSDNLSLGSVFVENQG